MRTVLVCVRTPLAAQNVASAAARLGLSTAVRTAVSDPEVMLRLAERPADVVLADTALTRPDSVGFTRRVLARAPGAAILLFGSEEPGVASAAIAAGARGLISCNAEYDLVSVVAKAMLLLAGPSRVAGGGRGGVGRNPAGLAGPAPGGRPGLPGELGATTGRTAAEARTDPGSRLPVRPGAVPPAGRNAGPEPAAKSASGSPNAGAPGAMIVPVQRGEDAVDEGEPTSPNGQPQAGTAGDPRANAAPDARFGADRRGESGNGGDYSRAAGGAPGRQVALTEREMQVLLGMADGKSNAEIGRELFVSEDTVKTHARRLFRKLGARDRAHAVAAGFRAGLVA
ncbi:LuxR C-terminal-related transcriptional regulator [Micromonospora sp. NPDC049559]|uniref:response regulator transcription factor n=1 Tax=Micromonospora sp. NPDC049559 TaxID=3155923 RepID=UPI0034301A9A